jgi:hypothetical protein
VSGGRNIGLQTKNKRGNRGQTSRNGEKICSEDRTSQKLGVFPQPVKPAIFLLLGGMAEAMPFQSKCPAGQKPGYETAFIGKG